MTVVAIAQETVKEGEKTDAYVAKTRPTIAPPGGKILAFDENPEVIEGAIDNRRTVLLEFDSKQAFDSWYNSPSIRKRLRYRSWPPRLTGSRSGLRRPRRIAAQPGKAARDP